ncbi:MAG: MmcQ/YjbR family DNA-binding protein [Bacteroidales bacterium]|jgi:predicted DNA-binding protein (MmcQ/YjbR family)|nr:MmcQ/YjbR family DNA-binding protein [Bacteroidales bacterium]
MDIEQLREYCVAKKGVTECFPFDEYTLVFKVMNKMFAVICLEKPCNIILKCDPEYAIELRENYSAITGAFHFNKTHWNYLNTNEGLPENLIRKLIDHSYELIVAKLTKKDKEILNNL